MPRDSQGRFIKGNPIPHKRGCGCFRCSGVAWNKGKKWPEEIIEKMRKSHIGKEYPQTQGENNVGWKGDRIGYVALHNWIREKKGKPVICTECSSSIHLVWANKSYEYKRDLDDWISLCQKCHMKRDAKMNWGQALRRFPDLKRYYEKRRSS